MQEAGSATKNREDKYQFDNVEREKTGGGKARHKEKKKRHSLRGTHTSPSRKNRERNASGGEKTEGRGKRKGERKRNNP